MIDPTDRSHSIPPYHMRFHKLGTYNITPVYLHTCNFMHGVHVYIYAGESGWCNKKSRGEMEEEIAGKSTVEMGGCGYGVAAWAWDYGESSRENE